MAAILPSNQQLARVQHTIHHPHQTKPPGWWGPHRSLAHPQNRNDWTNSQHPNIQKKIKKNNYSKTKFWNSLFFYTFQTDWETPFLAAHSWTLGRSVLPRHPSCGAFWRLPLLSVCLVRQSINQPNYHLNVSRWAGKEEGTDAAWRVFTRPRVEGPQFRMGKVFPITYTELYTVLCAHFSLIILNICMNQGDR